MTQKEIEEHLGIKKEKTKMGIPILNYKLIWDFNLNPRNYPFKYHGISF